MSFESGVLGRTGLTVCRLGLAASYGVPAAAVERAFERGVNYLYWGSRRSDAFGEAIRHIAPRREKFFLVIQSYSRVPMLVGWSLEKALRKLRLDHADVLLLGLWNGRVWPGVLDAARRLRERGLVRHLALSTHRRPLIPKLIADPDIGIFHVRYNAVHTGAEKDVFGKLPPKDQAPGLVSFTATSWRQLLDPRRVPQGERVPTAPDCYRFVLTRPEIDICLTGPANAQQMDEALETLDRGPMTDDELNWMRRVGKAIYGR
jgi:predicted aldo/keto reductase-like oxidoreductase